MFGEIESHAQMHIDNGILTGSITTLDETYHIEVSVKICVLNEIYTIITKNLNNTMKNNELDEII